MLKSKPRQGKFRKKWSDRNVRRKKLSDSAFWRKKTGSGKKKRLEFCHPLKEVLLS